MLIIAMSAKLYVYTSLSCTLGFQIGIADFGTVFVYAHFLVHGACWQTSDC